MNPESKEYILKRIKEFCQEIESEDLATKVDLLNNIRQELHNISPFKAEPVDFVKWVPTDNVVANDYNPNSVAPPEMQLLEVSIMNDGYTQPIVTWPHDDKVEVVDGFHRSRVGRESKVVQQRIQGYLPTVIIKSEQTSKNDRIASTIRHNRARGKHAVDAMSDIVIELTNRNWTKDRIAKELGMDKDEILRLCQITGLDGLFKDEDFSKAWLIEDTELEFGELTDEVTDEERELLAVRTVNTSDKNRIFHTYDKWECHKAGFYNSNMEGMTTEQCEQAYYDLLTNEDLFRETLSKVITEWKYSCEHYLTNVSMNRIAYLGQAALCYSRGIPSTYRGGFHLLSPEQQDKANEIALEYLNIWLMNNGFDEVDADSALMADKQTNIY